MNNSNNNAVLTDVIDVVKQVAETEECKALVAATVTIVSTQLAQRVAVLASSHPVGLAACGAVAVGAIAIRLWNQRSTSED